MRDHGSPIITKFVAFLIFSKFFGYQRLRAVRYSRGLDEHNHRGSTRGRLGDRPLRPRGPQDCQELQDVGQGK